MKNKRILLICLPLLVSLAACKKNQEPGSSSLGASDTASSYDSSADSSTGSSSQGTSLTESSSSSEGNSSHYDSSSAGSSGNTDSSSGGSEVEVSVLRIESKTTTANKEYTDASFVSLPSDISLGETVKCFGTVWGPVQNRLFQIYRIGPVRSQNRIQNPFGDDFRKRI